MENKPEKTLAELWDDLFMEIAKALRLDKVADAMLPACDAIVNWWEGLFHKREG